MSRSPFTPATMIGVSEDDTFPITIEDSRKQILQKYGQFHLPAILASQTPIAFFCCNNSVVARLQQGPTCGLVSLRMAAESIIERLSSPSTESVSSDMLQFAREMGVTCSGEMFSSDSMTRLAEKYYFPHLSSECWSSAWDSSFLLRLLETLCNGGLSLVPYDVDKNHEPCMSGGKKAHWAAIKGFVFPLFTSEQLDYARSLCKEDLIVELSVSGSPFFLLEPQKVTSNLPFKIDRLFDLSDPTSENLLAVITQQSKSKYQAVWKYLSLKDSNHNLQEFDSDRIAAGLADGRPINAPPVLDELRGKAVFISSK